MSEVNPNNPPPQGFGTQLFEWIVANILWIKRRLNGIGSGGGSGSTTLTENQIAYGSPANLVTSSDQVTYDPSTGELLIGIEHANVVLRANNQTFFAAIGDVSGQGNETAITVNDADSQVTVKGNFDGVSGYGNMVFLDGQNLLYKVGDVDGINNGNGISIDDTTEVKSVSIGNVFDTGYYFTVNNKSSIFSFVGLTGQVDVDVSDLTGARARVEPDKDGTYSTYNSAANGTIGTSSAMTSGTTTITTTSVHTGSIIMLTGIKTSTPCTTCGDLSIGTIVDGTSFDINSSIATDVRTVQWWIVT